ncbi:MAG TPA: endo alpha-1,4 polygalactosaminidase [Aggregatilineaceae bacterium]|nr:endo alpha-1,4 polygalactosaminidase [Aggregatilineaceae bacterium]
MKALIHFLIVVSLLLVVPAALAQDGGTPREQIKSIENYVVYYGSGRVDDLARYDLAIIQPDTLSADELTALKAQGTLVVSYLSIGEAEPEREWYLDGRVDPAWELGTNENWGSRFIDANQTGWQDLMVALTGEYLAKGFDGVFLDTVDTVDLFPQTLPGMIEIIRRLRETYPDALLVQNRGFTVIDETAGWVDALMFEDLVTTYDFINNEYLYADNTYVAQQMAELQTQTGIVILALDYVSPDNPAGAYLAVQAAEQYGFIPAVSTIFLDDIPDYGLDGPQEADIRVQSIKVETNGETYTLVITVENVGLAATTKDIDLSLSIGSEQVAKYTIAALDIGEQAQWHYEWANPPQSASVRVIAFSLDDKHPGNNSLQYTYHSESIPVEPLLPPDEQRRRPNENGPDLQATHLEAPLTMDGDLSEWGINWPCVDVNQAEQIIYGDPATWTGPDDLSGHVCYAWDDNSLYIGFAIVDDVIVQSYSGGDLWRGDHVELWFDTQLQLDFDSDQNSDDDFQVGISPGDFDQVPPSLVIWTPARLPDSYTSVEFAVRRTENGYSAEIRFPVEILSGLRLAAEHAIGASFDPSDTDTPGGTDQETMLSTAHESQWGVPTLWNNLILQD